MKVFDPDLESGKLNDNKIEVNQHIVRQPRNIVGEMMIVNEEQMIVKLKALVDAEVKKRIHEIIKRRDCHIQIALSRCADAD